MRGNIGRYSRFRTSRLKNLNLTNVSVGRKAQIATESGGHLVGDYVQRRKGARRDGEWAFCERGNNNLFMGEFPIYMAKMEKCEKGNRNETNS